MGVDQSTSSPPHTPRRNRTESQTQGREGSSIYAQMAKKVLLSREELFLEHSKHANGSTCDSNMDVYYDFLTQRALPDADSRAKESKSSVPPTRINPVEPKKDVPARSLYSTNSKPDPAAKSMNRSGSVRRVGYGTKRGPQPAGGMGKDLTRSMSNARDFKFKPQPKQKIKRSGIPAGPGRLSQTARNESSIQTTAAPKSNATVIVNKQAAETSECERSVALRQKYKESFLPQFDKVSLLPPGILVKILGYVADNFRVCLRVNPSWYMATMTAFDNHFNAVENSFVTAYSAYLLFKDSYTSSYVTRFCGVTGIRIDRVLCCENLPTTLGKAVTLAYTYKYCNEPNTTYRAEFVFDSVTRAPNCVWLHRNECQVCPTS